MATIIYRITINGEQYTISAELDISVSTWVLKYGRVIVKIKVRIYSRVINV